PGSIHAYHDMAGHTKHFTTLRELLHMVDKTDLQKLLGAIDNLYQREDPDTFSLLLIAGAFTAGVSILVLSAATLERMLKHRLEVPKLLVGGDLTMAEQLVTQYWMVFFFHVPFWNEKWLVQGGMALVPASVPAAPSFATDVSVSFSTTLKVPAAESRLADTPTASVHVSVKHSVAASTHSSSRRHRKHIAKKQVTPIIDIDDDALIKFDSDSGSDDDPLPYTPYAGWKMVPSPLGSIH
nr:hypothetical protein [Tanacetum cinerariifolium]